MKRVLTGLLAFALPAVGTAASAAGPAIAPLEVAAAARFAALALECVHREYPNKIGHVMQSDADARPPRALTPAFYGCYDWHSSVHGHWLLARLAKAFPEARVRRAGSRGAGAQPDAREHRGGGRVSARSGPGVVRAALWPCVAAAARGRAAHLGRSAGTRVGQGAVAARDRVGAANHGLAAQAQLSDPLGRAQPDSVRVRIDLGLGRSDRRRGHDPPARRSRPDLLRRGSRAARWRTSPPAKTSCRRASPRPTSCGAS